MLSIIIPVLNEEKYLPLLLKSIKSQDFTNYEIIVADAGSKDRTAQIAKDFGCRVVSGGLPAKGRNQGASFAKGDLLLFLDAEVILPEKFLSRILQEFRQRSLNIASCGMEPVKEDWMPKFLNYRIIYNVFYNWPVKILENIFPFASSFILVEKKLHDQANGFDENIKIAEDHDYARRISKIGKFGFLTSSKLTIFLRRMEKEGLIRISFKYIACNIFNILGINIKTDLFRYHFGQYNHHRDGEKIIKKTNPVFQFFWYAACYLIILSTMLYWILIILFFSPRLIIGFYKK